MSDSGLPQATGRTGSGGFTSQERKRYRKEKGVAEGSSADNPTAAVENPFADFTKISSTLDVLTSSLRTQLAEVAAEVHIEEVARNVQVPALAVPNFKVGTLEMYKRFPEAYEAFMDRHDCSAVKQYLLHDVLDRIACSRGPPSDGAREPEQPPHPHGFIRVADFGCGTGRIEAMVAEHPAVQAIYAYDGEAAMLKRCLVNTVKAARVAGVRCGVRLLPTASEGSSATLPLSSPSPSSSSPLPRGTQRDDGREEVLLCFPPSERHPQGAATTAGALEVVVRPCSFQSVQAGFLESTAHRPCQLVVCAWSLSHLMRLQWGDTKWHAAVDTVVRALIALLDTCESDAAVVIVETLGTGTETPTRSNTLAQRLEDVFGFTKRWVRTDYTFASGDEAARMTQFFFGKTLAQRVSKSAHQGAHDSSEGGVRTGEAGVTLMECTGMWTLWKARGT